MRSKLQKLAALVLLLSVACETGTPETPEASAPGTAPGARLAVGVPERAKADDPPERIYRMHCASCHGGRGGGDGAATQILPTQPGDWTNPGTLGRLSDEQIRNKILRGSDVPAGRQQPMRGYAGKLTDTEITALIGYIRRFGSH